MTTDDLQRRLEPLIEQWRHETAVGSRAKVLQKILSMMNRSGKLWRGPGVPRDLYEEALQNNWLWFTAHLAEYDPAKATVMHWFNQYLKWAISELQKQRSRDENRCWRPQSGEGRTTIDEIVAAPVDPPEEAVDFQTSLRHIKRCTEDHQRQLRRRSMRGRTDVSCDRIMTALLERVEQASSSQALSEIFAQLAADWNLDRDTFRRFCSSSCFKLLRQLCPPTAR